MKTEQKPIGDIIVEGIKIAHAWFKQDKNALSKIVWKKQQEAQRMWECEFFATPEDKKDKMIAENQGKYMIYKLNKHETWKDKPLKEKLVVMMHRLRQVFKNI